MIRRARDTSEVRWERGDAPSWPRAMIASDHSLRAKFEQLAIDWEREVGGKSLIRNMVAHPKYRDIIALGPKVVPHILERLKTKGGFWFGALHEITGANPVGPKDAGDRKRMTLAWDRWVSQNADRLR